MPVGRRPEPKKHGMRFIDYTDTYDRKWGYPYLTRVFEIVSYDAEQIVLVMAYTGGLPMAGA